MKKWYGWYVVLINAVIGISMTAGFPQFTMVVSDVARQMNTTEDFLLFTDTIKSIAIMAGMLVSGVVYNKLGLRKTFILSILAMVVPQCILPFLTSATFVIPLKIIQGFCSIIFPVFLLIIIDWIKESQVGTATAIFNGIFYGGSGIGATICGFAIAAKGWEASFFTVAAMTLIPAVIWLITVREKERAEAAAFEKSGGIKVLMKIVKLPQVWLLVLCLLSTIWMVQVLSVDLPLWGEYLGYDSKETGLIMSSISVGIFVAAFVSGRISDVFTSRRENAGRARLTIMLIGPILTILSILTLFVIDLNNFILFYGAIMILSFGGAWGLGAFYCILPEIFKDNTLTFATGFIGGCGDIGMPIGPLVVGVIFGVRGMWTFGWLSCILVALISIFACLIMLKLVIRPDTCRE